MRFLYLLISLLSFSRPGLAASRQDVAPTKFPSTPGSFKSTYPKQEHLKVGKAADMPAFYVPDDASTANYKVVDNINGKKLGTGIVRIFSFDEVGRGRKLGEIAAGTVVTLKGMRAIDKTIFYAIPYEGKIAWINGYFLAPAQ